MCHRPFYCNITAKVFANRGWKTIESHKSKTKTDSYCCNNFSQIFKQRFRFVLNLVTTSVNKLSVLPTCQPSLPTSLFFFEQQWKDLYWHAGKVHFTKTRGYERAARTGKKWHSKIDHPWEQGCVNIAPAGQSQLYFFIYPQLQVRHVWGTLWLG